MWDESSRLDLHIWLYLLAHQNGVSHFYDDPVTSNDLTLFTDSSSKWSFGAFYKSKQEYIMDTWDNLPQPLMQDSLSYLERYPVVAAAFVGGGFGHGKRW